MKQRAETFATQSSPESSPSTSSREPMMPSDTSSDPSIKSDAETQPETVYQKPSLDLVLKRFPAIKGFHPDCLSVPEISDECFNELVVAIKTDGQMEPIKLDASGLVLDGRSRLSALYVLDREPESTTIDAEPQAIARANIARRHLTTGQRAAWAAEQLENEQEAAAQRKKNCLKRGQSAPECRNSDTRKGRASELVALSVGVSRDSVEKCLKLPRDLRDQVKAGSITINEAARQAGIVKPKAARAPSPKCDGRGVLFESPSVIVLGDANPSSMAVVIRTAKDAWTVALTDSLDRTKYRDREIAIKKAGGLLRREKIRWLQSLSELLGEDASDGQSPEPSLD